jgi:mannosyl-3-phosphoglycerate phosphatase
LLAQLPVLWPKMKTQPEDPRSGGRPAHLVLFTDLDESLLGSTTYSFEPAREALELLRSRGIPLVLVSSKTRAEMEPLRFRLNHSDPFIVENGGGLFIPAGLFDFPPRDAVLRDGYQAIELSAPYAVLRTALKEIAQALGRPLRGFGDMTPEEIAQRTGLSQPEAFLAKQRDYDEPFLVEAPPELIEAVQREAMTRGLSCTRGGRFYHLTGKNNKGQACRLLADCYRRHLCHDGRPLMTVGIGDSLNDLSMLVAVDRPVLVQKPDGSYDPEVRPANLTLAPGIGPTGWNRAVLDLLRPG